MSAKIPKLSETCEVHWKSFFECIQQTTEQDENLYVLLKQEPVEDGIEESLALDDDSEVIKSPHYPIDVFRLYAKSCGSEFISSTYLGSAKRRFEQDSAGFSYAQDSIEQLKHQVGLRLDRLRELKREIFFTADVLGYEEEPVTEELVKSLFSSDGRELGVITEKILGD